MKKFFLLRLTAIVLFYFSFKSYGYEGFGASTKGAKGFEGYETYHVTNLKDEGPGSLRDGVSDEGRYVVFDTSGTIELKSTLNLKYPYVTIDGSSAPSPGITLNTPGVRTCIEAKKYVGPAHDIIINNLRIVGEGGNEEEIDILELDGSNSPIYNIVFDHITAISAGDGVFDFWGEISNVTVSYCLIMKTQKACHFSNSDFKRERISIHHNVYAKNNERQIKMRHNNNIIDFVNNTVYGWGWYEGGASGLYFGSNTGVSDSDFPKINIENNIYHYVEGLEGSENRAIIRDVEGKMFFSGNSFPPGETDAYSTSERHVIPDSFKVTMHPVNLLGDSVIPFCGTQFPSKEESDLLSEISIAVGGSGKINSGLTHFISPAKNRFDELEEKNYSYATKILITNITKGKLLFNALGRNIPPNCPIASGLSIQKYQKSTQY